MSRGFRILGLILLLSCSSAGVRAEVGQHSLWRVAGRHNVVYLLGSVHMLKTDASTLPGAALDAYRSAELLMMELDPTEMSISDQRSMARLRMLPRGRTLAKALGPALYAQFQAQALLLEINADHLSRFQPWYAALILDQVALARFGYASEVGVDSQIASLAKVDGKPILELETYREQLGFFSRLSMGEQREYVRASLEDSETLESDAATLVDAWKRGDIAAMEEATRDQSEESPKLYRRLTVERNRRWLPRIVDLLNRRENALVVVGAMHLVSGEGIVEMLKARGYQVQQQ